MGVEIDCASRFRKRDFAELDGPPQRTQRLKSTASIEGVELTLQLLNAIIAHPTRDRARPLQTMASA